MARSVKRRGVMEHAGGLARFRRRRLLAFLRRNNLPATFDAMKQEAGAFFDVQFLQRLVADGRWQEARGYVDRFLPSRDDDQMSAEARSALRFVAQLNVLDDLAHGKLGGENAADDLEIQIRAIPSAMADPHYTEAVRTVFNTRSHPADPVNWQLVRLKASQIVKDLITQAPELKHLMRMPRCPIDPRYTIPFGFPGCRRHKRKNIGQMPASLLARRFHPKERRSSSPRTQGSFSELMDLQEIIYETLLAGKQEAGEHSDSCDGIPGCPVGIGKSCGISPADAVKKCSSQEHYAESVCSAKLPDENGEFYSNAVNVPSVGIDPRLVMDKLFAIGEISRSMIPLLVSKWIGPDHKKFGEKLVEQERLLLELKVHCVKSRLPTGGTDFTT